MSLRARLLIAVLALTAIGLVVLDIVSYTALRSYLNDRVDQQVQSAIGPAAFRLRGDEAPPDGGEQPPAGGPEVLPFPGSQLGPSGEGEPPDASLPPGTFGELRDAEGNVLKQRTFTYGESGLPTPDLPTTVPISPSPDDAQVFDVSGSGGTDFRAIAVADPGGGDVLVVAVPLSEVDKTLDRLLMIELIVSAAILAALAIAGTQVVRIGLRPLSRMEDTARAIAAGDLSRRVETTDERTEVGRLGIALNEMLAQIESAFAEREESEQRLRQFLADASHELRTPLASIRGYSELFRLGAAADPQDVATAMARIESESERMGRLVDDLLGLARLDEGPAEVREPVALASLATEVVDDARAAAPGRPISVTANEDATALGDPDQLRRVLANLVSNAIRHTPDATPVEVAIGDDGDTVTIEVRDHGPGLGGADPEQVFERFWQGGSPGRGGSDRTGTGLGLAIVAAIAAAHGGRATAADAPGGGALFTVTLPAA